MNKVKIRDKRTGAVKEILHNLVGDYVGTGNFEIYVEKVKEVVPIKKKVQDK